MNKLLSGWAVTLSNFELTAYVIGFGIFIYTMLEFGKSEPLIALIIFLLVLPLFGPFYRKRFLKIKEEKEGE